MSDTGSNSTSTTTTNNQPPITWELIAKLTNDEYMARRKEIQKFIDNPKNRKGR